MKKTKSSIIELVLKCSPELECLDVSICAKCKGKCCKRMPGCYMYQDIIRIFGSVENAVKSGKVAIDWWEGDPGEYFMRPKTVGKEHKLFDPSWGGICIHYSPFSGCILNRNEMPYICKILVPGVDSCKNPLPVSEKLLSAKSFRDAGIDLESFREIDE